MKRYNWQFIIYALEVYMCMCGVHIDVYVLSIHFAHTHTV